jgi:AraC family transcriptional regulator, ethanolamine operon transcriptional activator
MTDGFGQYADSVQGAKLTYLKSERSIHGWQVSQFQLDRTVLQFGIDGGAGLVHGVTDSNLTTLMMQTTEFDDRIFLDGAPCASRVLVVLPPECHFTFIHSGPVKWFSWSIPKDDSAAARLAPRTTTQRSLKTEKIMVTLPRDAARNLRCMALEALGDNNNSTPTTTNIEGALFKELDNAWKKRVGITNLPIKHTRSAEEIVFRALRFVQSRPDQNIEIGDLAKAGDVGYRTLLRAFERYLKLSPKHYLKLHQINNVYHAIRKGDRGDRLADILDAHGVSEFGRFAGEYRSIFGELPSDTYQRHRRSRGETNVLATQFTEQMAQRVGKKQMLLVDKVKTI